MATPQSTHDSRYASKKRPCRVCGEPAWITPGTAHAPTHKRCLSAPEHGTKARYSRGCRCDECRAEVTRRQAEYMTRRRASEAPHLLCGDAGCTGTRKARGLCGKHLKRAQKADGTWKPSPSDAWDTPTRLARYKARKAATRGAAVRGPNFTVADLIKRDGNNCGICGQAMTPTATYPDLASPSIDHIIPVSRGGTHELANARAAHLSCNIRRGNRD